MFFVCVVFRVWWKTNRTRTAILPPAKVEGWERDFGPAVLLSLCVVWVFLLVHHMVPPLPTKTLRRCCLLLWRPTETDTPKKKKKKSLLLGLSQLSCFPPPLENVCLDYWKHRSRTNRSTPWDGTSPDVTGSCAARYLTKGDWSPILSDLCPSFERHLAVASYVSIASFLPHKVKIFFFFLNKVFSVRKMWLNQKIQHLQERDEL